MFSSTRRNSISFWKARNGNISAIIYSGNMAQYSGISLYPLYPLCPLSSLK